MILNEFLQRKWSPASKGLAAAGAACGLLAFLAIRGYAARVEALDPGPPAAVVVAARGHARGDVLKADDLRVVAWPSRWVPPGTAPDPSAFTGRVLLSDIAAGEPLTRTRLAASPSGSLAGLVPAGLRAVLVPASLPAGAVREGDHVDVLVTDTQGSRATETIAGSLEVLRVYPPADEFGGEDAVLALLADPSQAERLAGARALGAVSVSIVSARGDPASFDADPVASTSPLPAPLPPSGEAA